MIRKNRKNSLRVEAYDCEPGCQRCLCKFKIKINRKWIQDDSSDAAAFKKDWLKRFNRVYFNSTDKDGNQHEDVIPNFNVFQKPDDANSKIQVTCYRGGVEIFVLIDKTPTKTTVTVVVKTLINLSY